MKQKITIYFFIGFTIGAAFWLLSPVIFSRYEPWDYSLSLYWSIISITGVILGILAGKHFYSGIIGLYIGQALVPLFRPEPHAAESTPLYIGLLAMAILSSPSILFALLGWVVKILFNRQRNKVKKSNKYAPLSNPAPQNS